MKNKITPWLQSIGIVIPFMGQGFIFFIRTLLPAVGNPSLVTLAFQILSLLLIYSNRSFKTLYKGNFILFITYIAFLIYTLFFLFFNNKESGNRILDLVYISLGLAYLVLLHKVDYSISSYILKVILVLTLLINVSLIYTILTNPKFVIGMRATVNFISPNNSGFSGNPHIYARNGLNAIIISLLFLFKTKNNSFLTYIFYWICLLIGISVLFLTLVKTAIIIAPLIFITFLITKKNYIQSKINSTKILNSLITVLSITFFFIIDKIQNLIQAYGETAFKVVEVSMNTIFGKSSEKGIDVSTLERVKNLNYVKNLFQENPTYFIFGNGFRTFYVDVPFIEVFLNFGLIGILMFIAYLIPLYMFSIKNILKSSDNFQLFLSIFIISTILSMFTQGRPMEYGFYISAAIYIRFLGTDKFV